MTEKRYRMGAFDRPVIKDWAFWHGIAWAVGIGISGAVDPPADSTSPVWVDALGMAAVAFFMIGWPVALVRRALRRSRARRIHQPRGGSLPISTPRPHRPDVGASPASAHEQPAPPAPTTQPAPPPPTGQPAPPPSAPWPIPPQPRVQPTPTAPKSQPAPTASPGPAPPVPLSGYAGTALHESDALSAARTKLPYPVARAARAVQTTQDPLELLPVPPRSRRAPHTHAGNARRLVAAQPRAGRPELAHAA